MSKANCGKFLRHGSTKQSSIYKHYKNLCWIIQEYEKMGVTPEYAHYYNNAVKEKVNLENKYGEYLNG